MGNNSSLLVEENTPKYVFPTSFAQQRLWFLEKLQPGGTSYLIPWALRLRGPLNIAALQASLNEVVKRHEILRTTFAWQNGMPSQVVHGAMSISLPLSDLSQSVDREQEVFERARQEAHLPLDLELGPLVRAQLLRLAADDHVLLLTLHHIIFDGWSRRILVGELAAAYDAYCSGQPPTLAPPKLQYADYAVWQRKRFQGAVLEKHVSYWRERLAGIPSRLDLPVSRSRPLTQTFDGAKLPIRISSQLTEQLKSFSHERGVTPFMTLLAGFQTLLWRYSNQNDIVVGTPIANRNRAEIEEIIGLFTNTLVLRTQFSAGVNFDDVLAEVKETTLGAYEHQDLPFE
ncbi:MAG: non-ribosomal peptide synthetase, partial [Acidobacteria bacterium]|nr:non-ribosomal peptide synthetase [Acidobacteriota bacterium]